MEHILQMLVKLWKGIFVLSIFGTKIHVLDPFLLKFRDVEHFYCIDYKILPTVFQDIVQFREDIFRYEIYAFVKESLVWHLYIKLGFGLGGKAQ